MTSVQIALIRLRELESLDEARLAAKQNMEFCQARTPRAFDKMVRHRAFKKGEGPYIIDTAYSNGAHHLATTEGNRLDQPIDGKFLKKYFQ